MLLSNVLYNFSDLENDRIVSKQCQDVGMVRARYPFDPFDQLSVLLPSADRNVAIFAQTALEARVED